MTLIILFPHRGKSAVLSNICETRYFGRVLIQHFNISFYLLLQDLRKIFNIILYRKKIHQIYF